MEYETGPDNTNAQQEPLNVETAKRDDTTSKCADYQKGTIGRKRDIISGRRQLGQLGQQQNPKH